MNGLFIFRLHFEYMNPRMHTEKILFCINDCFRLVTIVFKQGRKLFDEGSHTTC